MFSKETKVKTVGQQLLSPETPFRVPQLKHEDLKLNIYNLYDKSVCLHAFKPSIALGGVCEKRINSAWNIVFRINGKYLLSLAINIPDVVWVCSQTRHEPWEPRASVCHPLYLQRRMLCKKLPGGTLCWNSLSGCSSSKSSQQGEYTVEAMCHVP